MNENEEISRNLQGDMSQKVKDKESAQETIAKIESLIDEMREMDYMHFLATCRVLVQANYDIAYNQLIAMLKVEEIMSEDKRME